MTSKEIDQRTREQQAAVQRASLRRRALVAETTHRFEGRSFTAAELFPEIDKMWQTATQFQKGAHQLKNISAEELRQADYNMLNLLELRALLKTQLKSPTKHAPGSEMWRKARDYQIAPILWLDRVSGPVLERQIKVDRATATVLNLPSRVVRYTLDQATQALGLPSWFLPTLAGAAVVAIGVRVYQRVISPLLPEE